MPAVDALRLGLGGLFGQGGVVAFAVDGGDFTAHRAEIGGELAAMVDGVDEAELEKEHGGLLDQAAKVHDFDQLFAGKFGQGVEVFGVAAFVFERAEKEVVEQEVSLFGGHVNHRASPCYLASGEFYSEMESSRDSWVKGG